MMIEVRVNGKRMPILSTVDNLGDLVQRLEQLALKNSTVFTSLRLNGKEMDIDNAELYKLRFEPEDCIEAKIETPESMSYESLQIALEMAELLIFDIKVSTLQMWDNKKFYEKSLLTLLEDCNLFLSLAAKPVYLLGQDPKQLPQTAEACLRHLDTIANHTEDATLLAVRARPREACEVLIGRVMPEIERWIALTAAFAQYLHIDKVDRPQFGLAEVN